MIPGYVPQTPVLFKNFMFQAWKSLRLPTPTPIQFDIADFLQFGPDRELVEAFRGVGKSWVTSAYCTWTLDHHPDWNILVVSASKQRADDFSTFTLRLIKEMSCLQHLTPGPNQRDSKVSFDVGPAPPSHAPSVKSLGITSQLSGSRADLIIADDIEVPNNSATQAMREKLAEQIKEFDSIVKPGGRIVFLGTPQCEQSVYNKLPERGFTTRIWPARYPNAKRAASYGDKLAPYIADKMKAATDTITGQCNLVNRPTDPRRFNDEDLLKREVSYGKAGFALQFMLDTNLSDMERYPLRVQDLIVMNCNPEVGPDRLVWAALEENIINDLPNVAMDGDRFYRPALMENLRWLPYQGAVMAIDPSGKGHKDELGYAVVKMLHGQLFLMASGGLTGPHDNKVKALAVIAATHKVKEIIVEENFGDGMFSALLRPVLQKVYPCTVTEVKHYGQNKESRICDVLEPVIGAHKLVVDRRVIEQDYRSVEHLPAEVAYQYRLIYQLTRITRDKGALAHEDRLDALAMAVAYWVEHLAKDTDEAARDAQEEALKAELERFMEHALGTKPKGNNWLAQYEALNMTK